MALKRTKVAWDNLTFMLGKKKCLKTADIEQEFIKECIARGFNEDQLYQVELGFKNGLTLEQIQVYARPEFSWWQMDSIRVGFIKGLSLEQISVYAKPYFSFGQMNQILSGFEYGLTMEQVKVYARPEFDWEQMERIKLFLIDNKDKPLIELYKQVKQESLKSDTEKLFIDAYEGIYKDKIIKEIKNNIQKSLPDKPKVKIKI